MYTKISPTWNQVIGRDHTGFRRANAGPRWSDHRQRHIWGTPPNSNDDDDDDDDDVDGDDDDDNGDGDNNSDDADAVNHYEVTTQSAFLIMEPIENEERLSSADHHHYHQHGVRTEYLRNEYL